MKDYLTHHWNASLAALVRMFQQPISSLLILFMLGIALALPLSLFLSVQSFQSVFNKLSLTPDMTLFIKTDTHEKSIQNISHSLKSNKQIKDVQFIDKEIALKETINDLGQDDLVTILDSNPLPDSFIVTPVSTEPNEIEKLKNELSTISEIDKVLVNSSWVMTLYYIKSFLWQVLSLLSITLGIVFVLIVHNTIKLQILAYRDEIEVTRLLGAPASFIRRPFIYQALWQGIFSLIIALALSFSIILSLTDTTARILEPYGIMIQWRLFTFPELFSILIFISFLAIIGAWWATTQHINEFRKRS